MDTLASQVRTQTWDRLAGFGAICFAVLVAAVNLLVPNPPAWDASGSDIARWVHDHHTALAISVIPFPVGMVGLMIFAVGFWTRARRDRDAHAGGLALLGLLGALLIVALFSAVEMTRLTALALDGSSTATDGLYELVWHLEAGAFALNIAAIAIALIGVALAAVRLGLAPNWFRPLAIVGLVVGVVASMQAPAMVNGAAGWQIGFVTFLLWLLLLLIVGTRMVRES